MTYFRSRIQGVLAAPRVLLPLVAVGLVGITTGPVVSADAKTRVVEWEGSAAALEKVVIRGGNGSVTAKAVDTDRVRIRVEVSPKRWTDNELQHKLTSWFLTSGKLTDDELIESIRLQVDADGERLDVSLRPGGRTRTSRVNEKWTIEMPARLALDSKLDAAEVDVAGLEGGVVLRLGYGSADLDLAGGDLDVKVTVGDLKVRTQGDYGPIKLRSEVGDTEMWLRGRRIEYPNPPGPGSRVNVEGAGAFKARVEVQVGDAELRVD